MCRYNDCGWCYAPDDVAKNDDNGMCLKPKSCAQYIPINFHDGEEDAE